MELMKRITAVEGRSERGDVHRARVGVVRSGFGGVVVVGFHDVVAQRFLVVEGVVVPVAAVESDVRDQNAHSGQTIVVASIPACALAVLQQEILGRRR